MDNHKHGGVRLTFLDGDATLLLPLSYAISRPALASLGVDLFVPVVPFLVIGAVLCRFADGVLHSLAQAEERRPDTLVCGLSLVCQLAGSASVWLVAEMVAVLGSLHLPAAAESVTSETVVGVFAVCGTAFAFVLPRVLRALRAGRLHTGEASPATPRRARDEPRAFSLSGVLAMLRRRLTGAPRLGSAGTPDGGALTGLSGSGAPRDGSPSGSGLRRSDNNVRTEPCTQRPLSGPLSRCLLAVALSRCLLGVALSLAVCSLWPMDRCSPHAMDRASRLSAARTSPQPRRVGIAIPVATATGKRRRRHLPRTCRRLGRRPARRRRRRPA
jgi:hypothetical protein